MNVEQVTEKLIELETQFEDALNELHEQTGMLMEVSVDRVDRSLPQERNERAIYYVRIKAVIQGALS